jgi:hypothetical protein
MRAAQYYGRRDIRVEDISDPIPEELGRYLFPSGRRRGSSIQLKLLTPLSIPRKRVLRNGAVLWRMARERMLVFDCAGAQAGLEAGMDALGFGGIYVNVAGWGTPVSPNLRSCAS